MNSTPSPWYRTHWFYLAALAIVAGDAIVVRSQGNADALLLEAGVLFDFVIVIPALYAFCYREQGKRTWLRALALACLGIWAAGHAVPSDQHAILEYAAPLRWLGLAVLALVEIKLVVMIWKSVARGGDVAATVSDQAGQAGMPPWVVRIMAWEARVWFRLWRAVSNIFRRS